MYSFKKSVLLLAVFLLFSSSLSAADTSSAEEQRQAFIKKAKEYIGIPYVTGGTDRNGFDCSGLVFTVGKEALDMTLPRTVAQLYDYVKIVADARKEPGDLLFFKTVGDKISHVGIYIGNDQFIHAASDGPNNGVIISSLHENYWGKAYFAVGQILPATLPAKTADAAPASGASQNNGSSETFSFSSFTSALSYNASFSINWSFLSPQGLSLNIRGATADLFCIYTETELKPGLGVKMRWDPSMKIVQIPIVLSLSTSDNLRFYAGPVITLGNPELDGTGDAIQASVFPGILGFSWQTNPFDLFGLETRLIQDISYTVFNNTQGAALNPIDAFASGLYMTTGLRVTIPMHPGV